MNEDGDIVRKCLIFLLEMLTNYDKNVHCFGEKHNLFFF